MELLLLGVCGVVGTGDKPLMADPAYTNYISFAERVERKIVTVTRHMGDNGKFSLPELNEIEAAIKSTIQEHFL